MTIRVMAAMVMMAGSMIARMAGGTAAHAVEPREELTIYVVNEANAPMRFLMPAEGTAARMFEKIGIRLEWRSNKAAFSPSQPQPIVVTLVRGTPKSSNPKALAYSLPFEGIHITIFFDRIEDSPTPATLLAHVMAHEITHILQRVNHHSREGVMKPVWGQDEFCAMRRAPLAFTPDDVELINSGLAARTSER